MTLLRYQRRERTMGRQRRTYQRRAYDGKAAKGAVDGHRRGWGYNCKISTPHVLFPFVGPKSVAQHTAIDGKSVDFFFLLFLLSRRCRHQPMAMDGRAQKISTAWEGWEGVILLNFHTRCIFAFDFVSNCLTSRHTFIFHSRTTKIGD